MKRELTAALAATFLGLATRGAWADGPAADHGTVNSGTIVVQGTAEAQAQPVQAGNPAQGGTVVIERTVPANGVVPIDPQGVTMTASATLETEKAAYLGLSVSPVSPAMRKQLGVVKGTGLVIDSVEKDSPADKAGLNKFDVLTKLNDQLLFNAQQLAGLVRTFKTGDSVSLSVVHEGKAAQVQVALVEKELPALDENNPWMATPPVRQEFHGFAPTVPDIQKQVNQALQGLPNNEEIRKRIEQQLKQMPQAHAFGGVGGLGVGVGGPGGPWIQSGVMSMTVDSNGTRTMDDGENSLTLTSKKGAEDHLVAKDKDGKVIFDGPVATEAQRAKVPAGIASKLQQLQNNGTINIGPNMGHIEVHNGQIELNGGDESKKDVPPPALLQGGGL